MMMAKNMMSRRGGRLRGKSFPTKQESVSLFFLLFMADLVLWVYCKHNYELCKISSQALNTVESAFLRIPEATFRALEAFSWTQGIISVLAAGSSLRWAALPAAFDAHVPLLC